MTIDWGPVKRAQCLAVASPPRPGGPPEALLARPAHNCGRCRRGALLRPSNGLARRDRDWDWGILVPGLIDLYAQVYDLTMAATLAERCLQVRLPLREENRDKVAAIREALDRAKGPIERRSDARLAGAGGGADPARRQVCKNRAGDHRLIARPCGFYRRRRLGPCVDKMDDQYGDRCWAMLAVGAPATSPIAVDGSRIGHSLARRSPDIKEAHCWSGCGTGAKSSTAAAGQLVSVTELRLAPSRSGPIISTALRRGTKRGPLPSWPPWLQAPGLSSVPLSSVPSNDGAHRNGQQFTARMIAAEAMSRREPGVTGTSALVDAFATCGVRTEHRRTPCLLTGAIGLGGRERADLGRHRWKNWVALPARGRDLASSTLARRSAALRVLRLPPGRGLSRRQSRRSLPRPGQVRPLPPHSRSARQRLRCSRRRRQASSGEPVALRNLALLELLYGSGLRASELVSLPRRALRKGQPFLILRGKGDTERLVPVSSRAAEAVERWSATLTDGRWLFPSRTGHLSRVRLFQIMREIAAAAGIAPERVSPHVCAAFATHLLAGGGLGALQTLWGMPTSPPPKSTRMSTASGWCSWVNERHRWRAGSRHRKARVDDWPAPLTPPPTMLPYLDFEKPIAELERRVAELRETRATDRSYRQQVAKLEAKSASCSAIPMGADAMQKSQVARHPDRPHFKDFVAG